MEAFRNKRVFVTGHTGFKGAWLIQVLYYLGADVKGFSLKPIDEPNLFEQINGAQFCSSSIYADILDYDLLKKEITEYQPDFIFHLAAQALVRPSYRDPIYTFDVNVMGTANVLEAMRYLKKPCVGVMVTTDKVYENQELGHPFKEEDKLGGHDPYSASKAAAEIIISSYRSSFFSLDKYKEHQKCVASVRAGNVIGGGDYSVDRIIPDIVRHVEQNKAVQIRNPFAIRPWQHVLEPLFAYLKLALKLNENPRDFSTSFNIGPEIEDILSVESLTEKFLRYYGKGSFELSPDNQEMHEAKTLMLDNSKIKSALKWNASLNVEQAIRLTAEWYADKEHSPQEKCKKQIAYYGYK